MKYHPTCRHCGGTGKVAYQNQKHECPVCLGRGIMLGTTIYSDSAEASAIDDVKAMEGKPMNRGLYTSHTQY